MKAAFKITLSLLLIAGSINNRGAVAIGNVDLMVRGGTIVTMDRQRRLIERGAIAIRGNRIAAVGAERDVMSKYRARRVINAAGKVIMPGLINTHTHVPMVLFRGVADDLVLLEWLQKYIFPAEAKNVDEQFVRWGTRLGCLEMIKGGTTTFCDMYYFEDAIAEETARIGMRAVLGETLIDFPAPDNKTWDAAIAYTEKFLGRWKGHALITAAVAPHAPYTVSAEHLQQSNTLSARNAAPLIIHVAEDQAEVKSISERYNASSVAFLDRIGLLSERVIAAHMVWPLEQDISTLAGRRVGVAHCPQSNMKLAAGVSPVPKLLRAGVAVGLGTDGAASNNDLNLWEEIDTAAKLHKLNSKDPTVLKAEEVLEMATLTGARAIHLDREIGSLEQGKRADLIVISMGGLHQTPLYNVYSQLAYATKASDVESVIIDGRPVMIDRRFITINESSVKTKAREYGIRIRKSLNLD